MSKMRSTDFLKATQIFSDPGNHEFFTWAVCEPKSLLLLPHSPIMVKQTKVEWYREACLFYVCERKEKLGGD